MPMQVILLERIEKLGQMGDVVSVKPGYARNYLLPRKKALRATAENKKVFEKQKAQLEAQNLERRTEAEAVASKMDAQVIVLIRQAGEAGQLYGSVNARDLATALEAAGFTVGRSQVELNKPIKTIGLHDVRVRLHPEVAITVTANVARTSDEADVQLKTGSAVIGGADQDDEDEAELADALAAQANAVFEDDAAAEAVAEARAEAGEDEETEGDAEKA